MIRVVQFSIEGVDLKLASMTWAEAEKFIEDGRALLKRQDAGESVGDEFLNRQFATIAKSLQKAGGEFLPEKIKEEFDLPTVTAIYKKVLEVSGLGETPGEARAATA